MLCHMISWFNRETFILKISDCEGDFLRQYRSRRRGRKEYLGELRESFGERNSFELLLESIEIEQRPEQVPGMIHMFILNEQ